MFLRVTSPVLESIAKYGFGTAGEYETAAAVASHGCTLADTIRTGVPIGVEAEILKAFGVENTGLPITTELMVITTGAEDQSGGDAKLVAFKIRLYDAGCGN